MSSTSKAVTIDDLPPEMICELFKHLNPNDLAACSMLNKRWHSIYSTFKVDRLVSISDSLFLYHPFTNWRYPNRKFEDRELFRLELFDRLLDHPLFSNLKKLALICLPSEFDLNRLNRFRELVHLEIRNISARKKVTLNMPKLKVLSSHDYNFDFPISIDCPNLGVLRYFNEHKFKNLLDVRQPETIRELSTNMCDSKLVPFRNVECLVTARFEAISKSTLLSLPKLKELRYNASISDRIEVSAGAVDRMKQTLREFMDDAKMLRGTDFKFRLGGFQLSKTGLDEIDLGTQVENERKTVCDEYIYMRNYHLIDPDGPLEFIGKLDYNRLMSNVIGKFPNDFFERFTGLMDIRVNGAVEDPKKFLWFLSSLRLRWLRLDGSELNQEFYDEMPASVPWMTELRLLGDDELQLSFDFIGKLSRLRELRITQDLSFESLVSLIRHVGKLDVGSFQTQLNKKRYSIRKRRNSTVWRVCDFNEHDYVENGVVVETENPDEIVHFFRDQRVLCSQTQALESLQWRPD